MNQLIPLIIAVILGGFATVLSLVLIGSKFSDRSADIKAQQFATAGSSIESAMRIYKTERSVSAFDGNFNDTMTDSVNFDGLVDLGYLTQSPTAPQGTYSMVNSEGGIYLLASGNDITRDVCLAVLELDDGELPANFTIPAATATLAGNMVDSRLHCATTAPDTYALIFTLE